MVRAVSGGGLVAGQRQLTFFSAKRGMRFSDDENTLGKSRFLQKFAHHNRSGPALILETNVDLKGSRQK